MIAWQRGMTITWITMQNRIDALWSKMWILKDKIQLEAEFQKVAESNDEMRELWSEYKTLKNKEK